jgi:ribosomal protein L18E
MVCFLVYTVYTIRKCEIHFTQNRVKNTRKVARALEKENKKTSYRNVYRIVRKTKNKYGPIQNVCTTYVD